MNKPELTIVMPFFDKPQLVVEMIKSIIANTYTNWELLAIDDGATEECFAYISQHVADPRVHFIHRTDPPKGAPKCRNIGLQKAVGKYVIFFDSDDYITPTCLENRVNAIKACPDMDFVVVPMGTYQDGAFTPFNPRRPFGYPVYDDDLAAFLRRTLPFVVCTNIYRVASVRRAGLVWDERLLSLQDADFNLQALQAGLRYKYASCPPDYGYRFENTPASITGKIKSAAHFDSHLYCFTKTYDLIQSRYGHRYDYSLYLGMQFIYCLLFAEGIDWLKAQRLLAIVKQHSRLYWMLLNIQLQSGRFLCLFLPAATAARISLSPYLLQRRLWEKRRNKKVKRIIYERN